MSSQSASIDGSVPLNNLTSRDSNSNTRSAAISYNSTYVFQRPDPHDYLRAERFWDVPSGCYPPLFDWGSQSCAASAGYNEFLAFWPNFDDYNETLVAAPHCEDDKEYTLDWMEREEDMYAEVAASAPTTHPHLLQLLGRTEEGLLRYEAIGAPLFVWLERNRDPSAVPGTPGAGHPYFLE